MRLLHRRPLREVVSWNFNPICGYCARFLSTSSWGRELKCPNHCHMTARKYVDLFVRSWVEIITFSSSAIFSKVDLFVRSWVEMPLRLSCCNIGLSTSSWGRELKFLALLFFSVCIQVDLFVRSWVEIIEIQESKPFYPSTSSWGRELKYFLSYSILFSVKVDLFVRSWVEIFLELLNTIFGEVDLFVRSWVEICRYPMLLHRWIRRPLREVVSWNKCYLHYYISSPGRPLREVVSWNSPSNMYARACTRRPLREVVSWNMSNMSLKKFCEVDLFVRSWVEITRVILSVYRGYCRPLREVVSWNSLLWPLIWFPAQSTSSWGRELKYDRW